MTDPGLADRIRHAARLSQDDPRVRVTGFDALTVERNRWRFTSECRHRVLDACWRLCHPRRRHILRHAFALWSLNVWWTREGLRCR